MLQYKWSGKKGKLRGEKVEGSGKGTDGGREREVKGRWVGRIG